ncbi:dihydromonapterin reductase [Alteromonas sp. KUL156]|uniref:dihydromonapterin reductase n=1 Tax=Alteromonas sp. KUL106 TaxID=2480799 RepID=UPI0012E620F1|nr:dihydromonapterin reductase [Alteromonas sp. KUL106]GFD69222.1 dihydromonapterin reductase [Alteromonas sp. KUL106]GFD82190.1 dihydromonapterin reductase [Tenacibaculum sp. KUL118]GFD96822.1 dihydromonapterin reductase [Alteromonas sp. KUL154]GFE00889.1 dihydromonapterin reductase [Alteromonas sp. KUL156]
MKSPVLITGASQRLGLAMAESLLEQGQHVVVTYRTFRSSITMLKDKGATVLHADFSTEAAIDRAIDEIKAISNTYRAIIHNASDWAQEKDNSDKQSLIERMMMIHAIAPYRINLALEKALCDHEGQADIIHMTDYIQETGSEKHMAYAASKAALHNLTLSFAKKLAPQVKVNSIAPALLMFNEGDDDVYKKKALGKSLLEIVPGAQEAVKAMNYLFDSDYVTGQTLHLNGGRHLK